MIVLMLEKTPLTWASKTYRPKRTETYPGGPTVLGNSEKRVALQLHEHKVPFDYEKERIKYHVAKDHAYTPDFKLGNGVYLEIKGQFLSNDRMKHITVKDQHPDLDIRFVFDNPNKPINKGSKTTYAMWCEKHGFLWCGKEIPKEWLK